MILKIPKEEAASSKELSVTKIQHSGLVLDEDWDFPPSLAAILTQFGQRISVLCRFCLSVGP